MGPVRALVLRTFADARTRTLTFALIFFGYALAQGVGYTRTFPTQADRENFARLGENPALRLFYGTPHHLDTLGGYASYRVAGIASLVAAFLGLLAAVRALRSEEESGRQELVLAGTISRPAAFWARMTAIAGTIAVLWLALTLGLIAGGLAPGGSAYMALGVAGVAAVYVGIGAVTSQVMPSGRGALELGGAVFGLDFVLRVIADTTDHQWLHWLMPLGWMEETRAFTGAQPAVLLLPAVTAVALLALALVLQRGRDVGAALFAPRDVATRPHLRLLRSPTLLALRTDGLSMTVWVVAVGGFAVVLGSLAASIDLSSFGNVRQQVGKFGADIATPSGIIGLYFLFFVLAIALFCCSQLAAARQEEAEGRLETLFALATGRIDWFGGRLTLATAGAALLGIAAGLGAAIGATVSGADVSYLRLLEAGLNCLPASVLFLGLGALLIAAFPRQGVGVAYALVGLAFFWELVGALLDAPDWLLGVSPFHQIGLIPAASFKAVPAVVMLVIGAIAAAAALVRFRTRDLVGV
jgi:ABC-2 type transport system permease protein